MKEDFLQLIWRLGYFDKVGLKTTDDKKVSIIHPGHLNTDAGPDFLNGQIKIEDQIWHGHIEIHTQSSEWTKHGHSKDPQYENVILHVVHTFDKTITYPSGIAIPTIELSDRIPVNMIRNHEHLMSQIKWIPCSGILEHSFSELKWISWSERLIVERLQYKIPRLKSIYTSSQGNWELTFYIWLAYGFGLKVNADTFTSLAQRVPLKLIGQYRDQPDLVHALFYGAADMLSDKYQDSYPVELNKSWNFLKQKHNLQFSSTLLWKYHRMRPASFPSLRISQFVNLLLNKSALAGSIVESEGLKSIKAYFELTAHGYWTDHNKFDHRVKVQSTNTGKSFIRQLLINVIVPYLFFYGQEMGKQTLKDRAIGWLQQMKAEDNVIIRKWAAEGVPAKHAADTQSLYHLKTQYCDQKACMNCSFGHSILKND